MSAAKTLTTKQLMTLFGVSHMSVYSWRQGSPTKEALPTVDTGGREVTFRVSDVKAWARKHKVPFMDESVLNAAPVAGKKPGPKARVGALRVKQKPASRPAVKRAPRVAHAAPAH